MARVIDQFVFHVNGVARDTANNKLHNEKTPQPTKGQRYDRLKWKSIFQTSWKENIPWAPGHGATKLFEYKFCTQFRIFLYFVF